MKKRVLSMAMATVMAASLTACGSGSTATTAAPTETNADTSAAASEAASEAAGSSDADVQKIIDRGVLKVGCKSDVPNFSLQNTATGKALREAGVIPYMTGNSYDIPGILKGLTEEKTR